MKFKQNPIRHMMLLQMEALIDTFENSNCFWMGFVNGTSSLKSTNINYQSKIAKSSSSDDLSVRK